MRKRRKQHSPERPDREIQNAYRVLDEGGDVAGVLRGLCVTEATHYRWPNQFGDMKTENPRKFTHAKTQNLQLKKILAEAERGKAALKGLAGGSSGPGPETTRSLT